MPALSFTAPEERRQLPALHQPDWAGHPSLPHVRAQLNQAPPLVQVPEIQAARRALARVARGDALLLQIGDCAESFYECTPACVRLKIEVLHGLASRLAAAAGADVVRFGRLGGQFAKPRSKPTERRGEHEIPAFWGHMVNSEIPTAAARRADPRRMLRAYHASARVLDDLRGHTDRTALGPWASHEALVLDYEEPLIRTDQRTGDAYLASTHLPWIGERTRQLDHAHVPLLARVCNPVACKIGPSATPAAVTGLCRLLDPERTPGRLTLIVRMGRDAIGTALPPIVGAVRDAGHPVVWLTDPMHGNTFTTSDGRKTRHLAHITEEAATFRAILDGHGAHAAGLHLEVASTDVTECIGGPVGGEEALKPRYQTLCDPRLAPAQAAELVDSWQGAA